MEQLGAGSRREGVQPLPEAALKLVRSHRFGRLRSPKDPVCRSSAQREQVERQPISSNRH